MRIRPASSNDYPDIAKLIRSEQELFLVYPGGQFPFTTEQLTYLAQTRRDLTVMEDQHGIIGFANLYNYQPGEYVYIGNVIIAEQQRGKGLGKQLVQYMLTLASQTYALPEVRISVFEDNLPARRLYQQLGFATYDSETRINPEGQQTELYHMRRLTSAQAPK